MENIDEKGIMVHHVNTNTIKEYKESVEVKLLDFIHIYHITTDRTGCNILRNPLKWLKQEQKINQAINSGVL